MDNAISLLSQFPTTKGGQQLYAEKLLSEIESGNYNPLECEILLKSLEEIISMVRIKSKDIVFLETEKYPEKTFTFKNVEITKSKRKIYDYSNCNDSLYNDLISEMNKIKEMIKQREKSLISGISAEGEILSKPIEKITEFLSIKFK